MGAQDMIWLSVEGGVDIFDDPEKTVELGGNAEGDEGMEKFEVDSRVSCGGVLKSVYVDEGKVASEVKGPYETEVAGGDGC